MASISKSEIIIVGSLSLLFGTAAYALNSYFEKRTQDIIGRIDSSISNWEKTADNFKPVSDKMTEMTKDIDGLVHIVESFSCTGYASERLCETVKGLHENGLTSYGQPIPFNDYMHFRA